MRSKKLNSAFSLLFFWILTKFAYYKEEVEEVKTCPVTMFRSQLRHVLPGDHCEAADKLPKMMPAAEFRKSPAAFAAGLSSHTTFQEREKVSWYDDEEDITW